MRGVSSISAPASRDITSSIRAAAACTASRSPTGATSSSRSIARRCRLSYLDDDVPRAGRARRARDPRSAAARRRRCRSALRMWARRRCSPRCRRADGHDPAVRRAIARGLADFVATGHALGFDRRTDLAHPMALDDPARAVSRTALTLASTSQRPTRAPSGSTTSRPARTALPRRVLGIPDVLAHGDWRIENVEVADGARRRDFRLGQRVRRTRDARAVATAARTFPVDWERPTGNHFPSDAEMRRVRRRIRGRARHAVHRPTSARRSRSRSSPGSRYGARCEHSDRYPEVPTRSRTCCAGSARRSSTTASRPSSDPYY